MSCERVPIHTPFIRLDALLKFCGAAGTGGHAKELIQAGEVLVDGEVCTARGKKLYPGAEVAVAGQVFGVVAGEP